MAEVFAFRREMQPARSYEPPPPDPREQRVVDQYAQPTVEEWEYHAVAEGLATMIRDYGAGTVMRYVTGEVQSDRNGLGYLVERYGYDRIVRLVKNLAHLQGQAI